jgi:hypothetical protein
MKNSASTFRIPGRTEMHYVTCRSQQMEKHKFDIR